MSHNVFISHSAKAYDQKAAEQVYDYLVNSCIECFMDSRDLVPGKPYPGQITKAITNSSIILLIFSSNSDNSEAVQNELGLARNNKIPIIPLRIEDVFPVELALFITTSQWLDAFPPPIENHLQKLVSAIRQHSKEKPLEPKGVLEVCHGDDTRHYPLKHSPFSIGRSADNDVVIADQVVSRYHARIDLIDGVFNITDLGSLNGTMLNDSSIAPNSPHPLNRNDIVCIGSATLTLKM